MEKKKKLMNIQKTNYEPGKEADQVEDHKDDVMTRAFLTALYNMNRVNSFQEAGQANHVSATMPPSLATATPSVPMISADSQTGLSLLHTLQKNLSLSFNPYQAQIQNEKIVQGNTSQFKEPLEVLMEQLKESSDTKANVNNALNYFGVRSGLENAGPSGSHLVDSKQNASQQNMGLLLNSLDQKPMYNQSKLHNQLSNTNTNTNTSKGKWNSQPSSLVHICSVCDREFLTIHLLKSHSITHETIKPFQCPSCSQKFSRKHDLTRHLKTHSKQKPFVCELCGRRFSRKDALKRHNNMKANQKTHCTALIDDFTTDVSPTSSSVSNHHFRPSVKICKDQTNTMNSKSPSNSFDIHVEDIHKLMSFPLGDCLGGFNESNITNSQNFNTHLPLEDPCLQITSIKASPKVSFRPPTTEDLEGYMTHSQAVEAVASSIVQQAFSRSA